MKVFLPHTSIDKAFVLKLANDLKSESIQVWLDEWEIRVGSSIVEEIDKALSSNDSFIIVLSPQALESQWVRKELNSSLMRHLSEKWIKVLPVLYQRCDIPTIINDLKYANFTADYGKGFAEICFGLGLINSTNWRHINHRQMEMADYHEMIRKLVRPGLFLNEQMTIVYALRNFPDHYDHTLRQLRVLRDSWSSNTALIDEIDDTIAYIMNQKET